MSYPAIELTTTEVRGISKLLLNAWSAEHALRITPTVGDAEFSKNSLDWTFPQAYYAAFFSARAVLSSDGIHVANQKTVNLFMNQRAGAGFYGHTQTTTSNPFSALMVYQLGPKFKPEGVSGLEALTLNRKLVDSVHALAIIHEGYILQRLGEDVYQGLIAGLPEYLRNGFAAGRAVLLTTSD